MQQCGLLFTFFADAEIEYFHLGVNPIFRESYTIGGGTVAEKGYQITDARIGCDTCYMVCPVQAVRQRG